MKRLLIATAASLSFLVASTGFAQEKSPTDWLSTAQFGVFNHFLPDQNTFPLVDKYDVGEIANQLEKIGAKYFVFTIYQNSGYFNAPNAVYDKLTGFPAGEKSAKRDLPMELANALAPKGIKLILYVTAQTPNRDPKAQEAFGLKPGTKDLPIETTFAAKWAKVFEEWSDRYGDKVAGWWVDGSYEWVGFNEEIAAIYSTALKKGNPQAIVAFNPGVQKTEWKTSDYTAGEVNKPLELVVSSKTVAGQQVQILTYLGDTWGSAKGRYENEAWKTWVQSVVSKGGAVTLEAACNMDSTSKRPVGSMPENQIQQLLNIRQSLAVIPKP